MSHPETQLGRDGGELGGCAEEENLIEDSGTYLSAQEKQTVKEI